LCTYNFIEYHVNGRRLKIAENSYLYDVLLNRVGKMTAEGKSLNEIKTGLRMPEYQSWSGGKERLDTNIEAAYRALKK